MTFTVQTLNDGLNSILPTLMKGLRQDLVDLIKEGVHQEIIALESSDRLQMMQSATDNAITIDFGLKLVYKDIAKISQLQERVNRLETEVETYKQNLKYRLEQALEDT